MIVTVLILMFASCAKEKTEEVLTIVAPEDTVLVEEIREKVPLRPTDYAQWQRMADPSISDNGKWVYYITATNRGDNFLTLHELGSGRKMDFDRAKRAAFSSSSDYLVFLRAPRFETDRQARIDKLKADKMPKDSLCVYVFEEDSLYVVPRVKSYSASSKGSPWIALHLEKPLPPPAKTEAEPDSTEVPDSTALTLTEEEPDTSKKKPEVTEVKEEKKPAVKKPKIREEGTPLWVWNPLEGDTLIIEYAGSYVLSERGNRAVVLTKLKGKPDSVRVSLIDIDRRKISVILETAGEAKNFRFDEKGDQLAFLFSGDTTKQKEFDIYYWKKGRNNAVKYLDKQAAGIPEGWTVSGIRFPSFSKDGKRLFFGTAPKVDETPEDTLLSNEKVHLDLWSWTDPLLQSQQLKEVSRDRNRNYIARVDVGSKKVIQLADTEVPVIKLGRDSDEDILLGENNEAYRQLISWESISYSDYYIVNVKNGDKELFLKKGSYEPKLSPKGNYAVWYEHADSNWYAFDVRSKTVRCLTEGLEVPFYNEDDDRPMPATPHGFMHWGIDERYVYIYDRYDIWKFDIKNEKEPLNVTLGAGRKSGNVYRYIELNSDLKYVPVKPVVLSVFHEKTKAAGFATANLYTGSEPEHLIYTDHRYDRLTKAKDRDVLIWRRGDYRNTPDLWVSDMSFDQTVRLSALNPQQSQYRWASVELVEWKNSDGIELQGLLYIPDDLDKTQKHPMIIYYYEKYSDYLHSYATPSPSYSTVSRSAYPSNGYILFVPDIVYKTGYPGPSGLDCVMSGVDMLLEKYPFINEERIGIQGQSWGGYQTAYFVTQTDRFAAAMAGAPVSNMTSAYGGIRYGSGMSRMMQYEDGQSRIGANMWDDFDLYYENSPVFFADRITTPLLMMHNDDDGAVPWTQGIEMLVAMRRLQKPAWMLVYNKDAHNLKETSWGNRMDLTIRMEQFFAHYLKDEPMPRWMKEGISALEKGKDLKYELVEE
jgi:dipeptidyl aminopeptidase/acylaminoacyl peptidase